MFLAVAFYRKWTPFFQWIYSTCIIGESWFFFKIVL